MSTTSLDFDVIRSDLVAFMKNQPGFTDYNFEGSNLSILINLLAFNAHKHGIIANTLTNETALGLAQQRNSVVRIAQSLGYIPHGAQPAEVTTIVCAANPSLVTPSITIPAETVFTAGEYNFYNPDPIVLTLNLNETFYKSEPVILREGSKKTFNTEFNNDPIILYERNIDMRSMSVTINGNAVPRLSNILTKPTDTIPTVYYLLEEHDDKYYKLWIYKISNGEVLTYTDNVEISYYTTVGTEANGLGQTNQMVFDSIVYSGLTCQPILEITDGTITGYAQGGTNYESLDTIKMSIRYGANSAVEPYVESTVSPVTNRMVTATDYQTVLKRLATFGIQDITAYGGESLSPVVYGTVFIAVKPSASSQLSVEQIAELRNYCLQYAIAGVVPVFENLVYLNLLPTIRFAFTNGTGVPNSATISTNLKNDFVNFINEDKFNSIKNLNTFVLQCLNRYSYIKTMTVTTDLYVESNTFSVSAGNVTSESGLAGLYTFDFFENVIVTGSVNSSTFVWNGVSGCRLNDSNGILRVVQGDGTVLETNMGTVNYTTGQIVVGTDGQLFIPDSVDGEILKIIVTPNDGTQISNQRNSLLNIETTDVVTAGVVL